MQICEYYRENFSVHASSAILFNHGSPRRKDSFVSRKIVKAAIAIKSGLKERLVLGNLGARIDWGYAPDYVQAMKSIVKLDKPEDFIIASGNAHTVGEFVDHVFSLLGLCADDYVYEEASLITREKRQNDLIGNPGKIQKATNWKAGHTLGEIARYMVDAELQYLAGERK